MNASRNELANFAASIVRGETASAHLRGGAAYSLATGIDVYRNNYRGNLQDALAGAYPVIGQLVGSEFFRMLARQFIAQHPSRSGNLYHYGTELADFLKRFAPAQELVYLPDIAALEWACHCAYFAADAARLDLSSLAQVPQRHYPHLVLRLHPACRIVRSPYPIAAIWQAHQAGAVRDFHIDLDGSSRIAAHIALVSRAKDAVQVSELDAAGAQWLQFVMDGAALGAATAATLRYHPDFNLPGMLLRLASLEALSHFTAGGKS